MSPRVIEREQLVLSDAEVGQEVGEGVVRRGEDGERAVAFERRDEVGLNERGDQDAQISSLLSDVDDVLHRHRIGVRVRIAVAGSEGEAKEQEREQHAEVQGTGKGHSLRSK